MSRDTPGKTILIALTLALLASASAAQQPATPPPATPPVPPPEPLISERSRKRGGFDA